MPPEQVGQELCHCWPAKNEESPRPTYRRTRSIFLRGLGLTYMAAFASMAVQVDGLIGSHGILPVADYLDRAQRVLGPGPATYWRLPTLLWLNSSDRALHALCWGGLLAGCRAFRRVLARVVRCLALALLPLDRRGGPGLSGLSVGCSASGGGVAGGAHGTLAGFDCVAPTDRTVVVHGLAGAMARVSLDVHVGRGQAGEPRSHVVGLERARFPL